MQFVTTIFVLNYIFVTDVGFVNAKQTWNTIPAVSTRRTTFLQPRVISKTCLLKPEEGPCRGKINMYYYEHNSIYGNGSCKTFEWGGCQGNGNRFDTEAECNDKCLSKPTDKSSRFPKWCTLAFDYGFCFGDIERWYYDRLWKVCKKTIFSGCGGNKNNFHSKEQCDSVCRFGQGFLRSQGNKEIKDKLTINTLNMTPKRGKDQEPRTLRI